MLMEMDVWMRNQKNMYSDEDEKHTYVISDFVT